MWNVALSDTDAAVLALGYSPLLVRRSALVSYWPLLGFYSPEIDLLSSTGITLTGTTQSAHTRVFYPRFVRPQNLRAAPTPPSPPPPPSAIEQSAGRGGRRRRILQTVSLPQQIVDDLAALYRTIYAGRQALDPGLSRRVAELVGFFSESYDGRLPPPEAVHFRDMAEYPAIDLSVLTEAADAIIARGQQIRERPKPEAMADWMVAAARQGYAVDRAMARMKRDAEIAAARAADQEEEDAIMALLTIL